MRDVRTPGDPQDFESGLRKPPPAPSEVRLLNVTDRVLGIQQREDAPNRPRVNRYRVYFLAPDAVADSYQEGRNVQRAGRIIGEVPAKPGNYEVIFTDTVTTGAGAYVVTSVSVLGVESEGSVMRRIA